MLYADTDVVFLREVRRPDFRGADAPAFFAMGAELPDLGPEYGNAGVMLLNLDGLRRTRRAFQKWVFSQENVKRGLHFGTFGPGDQGAFSEYYAGAFAVVEVRALFPRQSV